MYGKSVTFKIIFGLCLIFIFDHAFPKNMTVSAFANLIAAAPIKKIIIASVAGFFIVYLISLAITIFLFNIVFFLREIFCLITEILEEKVEKTLISPYCIKFKGNIAMFLNKNNRRRRIFVALIGFSILIFSLLVLIVSIPTSGRGHAKLKLNKQYSRIIKNSR